MHLHTIKYLYLYVYFLLYKTMFELIIVCVGEY